MIGAVELRSGASTEERVVRDLVLDFIEAFNRGDVEAMIAFCDPAVELHTMRGLRKGHEGARQVFTREPGGVQPALALDRVFAKGAGGGDVVAFVTRQWRWAEDGSVATEPEEIAFRFERRGGRVLRWQPFADRAEALRAGGFVPPA